MHIGLLCEGSHDIAPLSILIRRIVEDIFLKREDSLDFSVHTTRGSITPDDLRAGISKLRINGSDFLIFVFDTDGDISRKKKIREIIIQLANVEYCSEKVVFGFPDSEFEKWLLSDEDAIKRILSLPGSLPLGLDPNKDPKENLNDLIDDALAVGRLTLLETRTSIYGKIAASIDLAILEGRQVSFREFSADLRRKVLC